MGFSRRLFGNKSSALEKEWAALLKSEARFLERQKDKKPSILNEKLESVVPEKLRSTLDLAFYKAFELVFLKGTGLIEKTYQKEKQEYNHKINAYAAELKESRKNLKAFSKQAGLTKAKNVVVSGVEGIGTGIFGVGLPDIPLFTGMVLKSLYEIAISYGYSYDTEEEQVFLMNLIRVSLAHGKELAAGDEEINRWIEGGDNAPAEKYMIKEVMRRTADRLSEELLYMKFVQGLPIVGVVGGISDCVYLKRITDYAELKFRHRMLCEKKRIREGNSDACRDTVVGENGHQAEASEKV